jgi:hypothetical protein
VGKRVRRESERETSTLVDYETLEPRQVVHVQSHNSGRSTCSFSTATLYIINQPTNASITSIQDLSYLAFP